MELRCQSVVVLCMRVWLLNGFAGVTSSNVIWALHQVLILRLAHNYFLTSDKYIKPLAVTIRLL